MNTKKILFSLVVALEIFAIVFFSISAFNKVNSDGFAKGTIFSVGRITEIHTSKEDSTTYVTFAKDPANPNTAITLITSNKTLVVSCDHNQLNVKDLKKGDIIGAHYSNKMTKSIPPQTKAYRIDVKLPCDQCK